MKTKRFASANLLIKKLVESLTVSPYSISEYLFFTGTKKQNTLVKNPYDDAVKKIQNEIRYMQK